MRTFGEVNLEWFGDFFPYEKGVPSNVTLGRVFLLIDIEHFNELFTNWAKGLGLNGGKQTIAVDGKRLRGSYDKAAEKPALHVVSAFAVETGICIAQKSCDAKSNEITVIPEILTKIGKGAVITIDAMGCQKHIAKKIIENR